MDLQSLNNNRIKLKKSILVLFKTIIFALIIAGLIRTIIFEHCKIPTPSMTPSFLAGDHLFVSKYIYGISGYSFPLGIKYFGGRILDFYKPKRGEVIVFRLPADPSTYYIKRLIGLPGDEIKIINGEVFLNGNVLPRENLGVYTDREEPNIVYDKYLETLPSGKSYTIIDEKPDYPLDNTKLFKVPENHYFFMGDNRDDSADSRIDNGPVGYVHYDNIVGRAEYVIFSMKTPFWQVWNWFSAFNKDRFLLDTKKL